MFNCNFLGLVLILIIQRESRGSHQTAGTYYECNAMLLFGKTFSRACTFFTLFFLIVLLYNTPLDSPCIFPSLFDNKASIIRFQEIVFIMPYNQEQIFNYVSVVYCLKKVRCLFGFEWDISLDGSNLLR